MPIQIKPPENLEKWIYENVKFKDHPVDEIKNSIEAALSQSTLECPLVWEDLPDDTAITWGGNPVASASQAMGFVPVNVYRTAGGYKSAVMGIDIASQREPYPTLEAAKSAAQDWVNAEINKQR